MAARREIRPVDREPPVTPDYLDNAVAYFADGGSLAPGHHSMTYVSGCVKYDGYSNFTINGQSNFEYPARDAFLRRHGGGCRTAGTVSSSADRSIDPGKSAVTRPSTRGPGPSSAEQGLRRNDGRPRRSQS